MGKGVGNIEARAEVISEIDSFHDFHNQDRFVSNYIVFEVMKNKMA